jgi:hypothetical protein
VSVAPDFNQVCEMREWWSMAHDFDLMPHAVGGLGPHGGRIFHGPNAERKAARDRRRRA